VTTETTPRSQQEIRARFDQIHDSGDDFFGFRQEALAEAMEFDTVVDMLKEGATAEDWTVPDVKKTARDYLEFAIGKATDHRGISAERSIDKLREWLWCLGDDELLQRFESAEYEQYGAPKLLVLAEAWGVSTEDMDSTEWQRMSKGIPCSDTCYEGCGA